MNDQIRDELDQLPVVTAPALQPEVSGDYVVLEVQSDEETGKVDEVEVAE